MTQLKSSPTYKQALKYDILHIVIKISETTEIQQPVISDTTLNTGETMKFPLFSKSIYWQNLIIYLFAYNFLEFYQRKD